MAQNSSEPRKTTPAELAMVAAAVIGTRWFEQLLATTLGVNDVQRKALVVARALIDDAATMLKRT